MNPEWYAVKGLFRWYFKDTGETERIEERVVIFFASGFDQALDLAEEEGSNYCAADDQANFCIEPIGWWHAYWIGSEPLSGTEVFSRSCRTTLDGRAFVRRYYPKVHGTPGEKSRSSVSS